ncbi:MAG: ABC transporter permease, partial [Phycisphaerales bacterium]
MGALWQDVRYGMRMLRKSPGFTAIALITLAVGIGANTIMFSMVNVLLLRPVMVRDADRLVGCDISDRVCPYALYVDMRDDNPVFAGLMAQTAVGTPVTLVQGNVTRLVSPMFVSANYFSLLDAAPACGRDFLPEEERDGAEPVAVLGYRMWERQGADPNVVDTQVAINGTFFRIVGVAPKGFTGTAVFAPDLWLPLGVYGLAGLPGKEKPAAMKPEDWNYPFLSMVGRLKPGLDAVAAEAQLQSLIPRLREKYPRNFREKSTFVLQPLSRMGVDSAENETKTLSITSAFLMGVSAVVLLIACLNLANMMIVQGAGRHREIAIRMAVGGGRLRILRQLLIESLLLAMLGGALGLVLAFWGTRIVNACLDVPQLGVDLAGSLKMGLDGRVLGATLGFCVIATVLFGLKPAIRLSKRDITADIRESTNKASHLTGGRRRFLPRGLSVVGQIALSVVLVMGAVLFTRSALHAAKVDPGFTLDGKVLIEIDPLAGGYDRARGLQLYETLTDRFRSMPGVQAVAVSTSFPFEEGGDYGETATEYVPGTEDQESETPRRQKVSLGYVSHAIGGEFFESMGIPLLQGRAFNRLDSAPDAEKVVVINEGFARKLRPDGNALGCLIRHGSRSLSSMSDPYRVIGIVPNVWTGVTNEGNFPQIYLPMEIDRLPKYIHVRIADGQSEAALLKGLLSEIHMVDSHVPIVSAATLAEHRRDS